MFALSSSHKFWLYGQATDMRKGFNGLSGIVRNELLGNPMNGDVFIFINKRRDKIKLLHWVGVGFTVYYKQLEQDTFELPEYDNDTSVQSIHLSYTQLVMLIDGLIIKNVTRRKRYSYPPNKVENEV